jgi:hypothetical protein
VGSGDDDPANGRSGRPGRHGSYEAEDGADGGGPDAAGGRTFAKWSHVNLQRHNEEIDQRSEQAFWNICLIRRDRTTLWCETNSNLRQQGEAVAGESVSGMGSVAEGDTGKAAVELILSMRPVRDGPAVPASVAIIPDKPEAPARKKAAPASIPVEAAPAPAPPSSKAGSTGSSGSAKARAAPPKITLKPPFPEGEESDELSLENASELTVAKTLLGLMGRS